MISHALVSFAYLLQRYAIPLLTFHIVCGFSALMISAVDGIYTLSATPLSAQRKATRTHRALWGGFHIAMTGVGVSAILLSLINVPTDYFLLSVALFTLYMTTSAARSLFGGTLRWLDAVGAVVMLAVGIGMVAHGLYRVIRGNTLAGSLILFGIIGTIFAVSDIRKRIGTPISGRFLARNFGALIAAVTAFLVTNIHLPGALQLIVWIAPTAFLSPLIFYLYAVSTPRYTPHTALATRIRAHIHSLWGIG